MISRLRAALPLAGVLVVAAALRFYAIDFGMPYTHARPDETTAVGHAAATLGGDPNPHFFNWPSLALYTFAAALAVARAAGRAATAADQIVIARLVVATAGTLTVLVTAAMTRSLAGSRAAVIAALFLAVAPLHVRESHFAMTDVLMTLLLTASLALAMRAREPPRARLFALAGAAGGLATSTKYSAGVILTVAAAAPTLAAAAGFIAAWGVGFLAGTPFALLDFRAFAADVSYERSHLAAGHTVVLGRGWIYHLTTTLPYGMGRAIYAAAAAGVVVLALKHRRQALPLALFAIAFYVSMGAGFTVFFRYALPLLPIACACAAVAVGAVATRFGAHGRLAAAALGILVALPSLVQSAALDRLLAKQDSRVIAAEWLAARLQPEDTVHDSGGDYTRLSLGAARFHAWRYDAATRSFGDPPGAIPGWIVLYESPLPEYTAAPDSLRELVAARYELAYRIDGVPGRGGNGVYDRQDAFFLPIHGFKAVARPGPTVLLYKRRS